MLRLTVMPTATQCVACLSKAGDVPLVRRFDEYVGEEQISTYFIRNSRIENELRRVNGDGALSDEYMELAVGDDSFMTLPDVALIGANSLASVFEPDEEPSANQSFMKAA